MQPHTKLADLAMRSLHPIMSNAELHAELWQERQDP